MALPTYLNFASNIRTHACFVGVIVALDSICTLLIAVALRTNADQLPKELNLNGHMMDALLGLGIVNSVFAIVYWVGFLKRQRWCLTVFVGFLAIAITLQFIAFLGAILQLLFVNAFAVVIALAVNGYVLLVTLQLRKVITDLPLSQDGFSA